MSALPGAAGAPDYPCTVARIPLREDFDGAGLMEIDRVMCDVPASEFEKIWIIEMSPDNFPGEQMFTL